MSPTSNVGKGPLRGLDAEFSAQPISQSVRGGVETGFDGSHSPPDDPQAEGEQPDQFEGMGPFLKNDDATVFKDVHALVLRQERLAKNRKASDDYWTHVKQGHGLYYRLEKVPDQDIWRCAMAPGTSSLSLSPVPNKSADLCNKIVEAIMVDPFAPSPRAETDAEESERAAEMAEEFLTQDGGEAGTRDHRLFWQGLGAATSRAASFLHAWVDPCGGGSIPLQIKAHPQAVDPANPLVGPDGSPTTDLILRHVTAPEGGQFTEDPSQAAPQWQPKIRVDRWGREHVRIYPETADISDAEKVIALWYCTLGEAKRRFPDTVGALEDETVLGQLCDWTPPRYLSLLPVALRARWKLLTGDGKDAKGTSNDERLLFFYIVYCRQTPLYPKGAVVYVSGADGGSILSKDTLSSPVPMPRGGTDLRAMDIPITQIDLVLDDDDGEPLGLPLIERFGGAGQALSQLGTAFLEQIDKLLHPAAYTTVTSPVTGDDVANSRATGDHIQVLSKEDYPQYEEVPPLPGDFLNVTEWLTESMHSAAGNTKASVGDDKQQEVSGVARNIAVQQANVALSRFQQTVASSHERYWRIKLQLVMKHFSVPQQIRYEGEDGAYKQEWWTGVDFAKVTDVRVQSGTGTMLPPQQKVQYLAQLVSYQFMDNDDAKNAARPAFTSTLGLPPDIQQQRIERQVGAWLKGPPSPEWIAEAQAYQQAKAVADQETAQQHAAYEQDVAVKTQAHQQATNDSAAVDKAGVPSAAPAAPVLPPPPSPVQPSLPAPWTPFASLPMDDEPLIAQLRQRRLRDLMGTVRFSAQPPEWQQVVVEAYTVARQAVAAAQAPPALPKGVTIGVKAGAGDVGKAEQAATHPNQQAA